MEQNQALSWDQPITAEVQEYVILEPGDYDFRVDSIEKGQFNGSEKMGPCPMAKVNISIEYKGQRVPVSTQLLLNTKLLWKISEFYISIGYMKKGETKPMNWQLAGWTGKCRIKNRLYNNNTFNEIDKFLPREAPAASQYAGFGVQ